MAMAVLIAGCAVPAPAPVPAAAPASATRQTLDLQAHRGGRALRPENTLAAFSNAIALGVTTLELDIGLTADDVVVISHDMALNPAHTRDAQGAFLSSAGPAIRTLTLAQLQAYDVGRLDPRSDYARPFPKQLFRDGERIPTLAALFERVHAAGADQVRFNIETKVDPSRPGETASPEQMTRALLAEIDNAGMAQRVTIQSFDWRTLALVRDQAPQIPRAYLTSARTLRDSRWTVGLRLEDFGSAPRLVKAAAGAGPAEIIWSPAFKELTPDLLKEAHALGLRVLPWTVDERADMVRLIGWGVDGLITDDPAILRDVMREKGLPLPPRGR
jgi:glycerophosphoryl diester phosphodiesterase